MQGRTFPSKGETVTAAGLVIKDKYIASVSGGEFGVRCHVTAYDINTGQQVWRAYSMGPDEDVAWPLTSTPPTHTDQRSNLADPRLRPLHR